jgi:hypothetical protein
MSDEKRRGGKGNGEVRVHISHDHKSGDGINITVAVIAEMTQFPLQIGYHRKRFCL